MNTINHVPQDDLYLFALQLLPGSEMGDIALHLKDCTLCSAQVADAQGDLAAFALTVDVHMPSSQARERLLQQVAKEKKIVPIKRAEPQAEPREPVFHARNSRTFQMESPEKDPRRNMGFMGWAGWAVAAGVAVVAGLQYQQRQLVAHDLAVESATLNQITAESAQAQQLMQTLSDPSALQVSLHIPKSGTKADPEAHAVYVPSKASLVFVASHLDALQPAKTYELWLLPAQAGVAPIPAGLFKPDVNGNASVIMPKLPQGVTAKGFGVTVEAEGGAATPTAPIILAGF